MKVDCSLITLVPADEYHREFSYRVKKEAEGEYIRQTWGWDEKVQRDFHTKDWEEKRPEVIRYDGRPIGTILVMENEEFIKIRQFFILPEYQNRGIGSHVLKGILDKADRSGKVNRLTCLKSSRAVSLYRRHGFETTDEDENFIYMERILVQRTGSGKSVKYRAVIFDLFGTLIDNLTHSENKSMLSEMASILDLPPEEFMVLWLDTSGQDRFTGVYTDLTHTLKALSLHLNREVTDTQVESAVRLRNDYVKRAIVPRTGTTAILGQLKSAGYWLGIITDCSAETVATWDSTTLAPFFDTAVFSCSEGMTKPDARIYQIAAERLEVTPESCLYIGDGDSDELTGARQAGMHPVLIRDRRENSNEVCFRREEWDGMTISSLQEIPALLE